MTAEFEALIENLVLFTIGTVLLLLGRRIFWALGGLAVAVVGVIVAVIISEPSALTLTTADASGFVVDLEPSTLSIPILIGSIVGFSIGVFLTIRYPKIAAAVVGFVAGAFILFVVFDLFGFVLPEWARRSLFIIAGTIVAAISIRQTPETLIILSTVLGANTLLDVTKINLNSPSSAFVWLILMLFGIIFQMKTLRDQQHRAAAQRLVAAAPSIPKPTM